MSLGENKTRRKGRNPFFNKLTKILKIKKTTENSISKKIMKMSPTGSLLLYVRIEKSQLNVYYYIMNPTGISHF